MVCQARFPRWEREVCVAFIFILTTYREFQFPPSTYLHQPSTLNLIQTFVLVLTRTKPYKISEPVRRKRENSSQPCVVLGSLPNQGISGGVGSRTNYCTYLTLSPAPLLVLLLLLLRATISSIIFRSLKSTPRKERGRRTLIFAQLHFVPVCSCKITCTWTKGWYRVGCSN